MLIYSYRHLSDITYGKEAIHSVFHTVTCISMKKDRSQRRPQSQVLMFRVTSCGH